MKFKTIEERVADQRDINVSKVFIGRMSVVADRAISKWENRAWPEANLSEEKVQTLWVTKLKRIVFLAALLILLTSGVGALAQEDGVMCDFNDGLWCDGVIEPIDNPHTATIEDCGSEHGQCIKFPALEGGESACVATKELDFKEGELSFRADVSSQDNWDYLGFYDNGQVIYRLSGEVRWTTKRHAVQAGPHTFKWCYRKDHAVTEGNDTAFLDDITLPPLSLPDDTQGIWYTARSNCTSMMGPPEIVRDTPATISGCTVIIFDVTQYLSDPHASVNSVRFRVLDADGKAVVPEIDKIEREPPFGFTFNTSLYVNGIYDVFADVKFGTGETGTFVCRFNIQN